MTVGQNAFPGFEIEADYVRVRHGSADTFPVSRIAGDREPQHGDEFEVTRRYRITKVGIGSDGVDDAGNFKDQFAQTWVADSVRNSLKVTRYVTNEDRESVWADDHGATG
jgi:hypothetical protein